MSQLDGIKLVTNFAVVGSIVLLSIKEAYSAIVCALFGIIMMLLGIYEEMNQSNG